jgi:hypothetical protein
MASSDALKIAFYVILILALIIAIYGHYTEPPPPPPPPPQPQLVTNQPAGLYYKGPVTTALAGYYCIESINSSNGYSIQLNALLSNGLWIQNAYGTVSNTGISQTFFEINVWSNKTLLHAGATQYINTNCAWMIITINDETVYFGYSLDGEGITWYDSYPVGNAVIEPVVSTELVLGGYGHGEQVVLGNGTTLVYLALYYWNGTNWVPAPVGVLPIHTVGRSYTITAESVNHAYVFTDGSCGGVVSWPNPVNETICPSSPSFKP